MHRSLHRLRPRVGLSRRRIITGLAVGFVAPIAAIAAAAVVGGWAVLAGQSKRDILIEIALVLVTGAAIAGLIRDFWI